MSDFEKPVSEYVPNIKISQKYHKVIKQISKTTGLKIQWISDMIFKEYLENHHPELLKNETDE